MESEVLQRNPSFSESEENLLEIIRNGPYISSPPPLPDHSRKLVTFECSKLSTCFIAEVSFA